MLGRGAVAGTGRRRCGAVFPSRRSKPLGPGAPAARHGGVRPMGKGQSVRDIPQGPSRAAEATSSDSRQVQKRWRGRPLTRQPESVSPPGVERSKPINTARGTPGLRQFRGDYVCALSTKHRAQSCGVVRTPAFRAPSLGAKAGNANLGMRPARGRPNNAGDDACLSPTFTLPLVGRVASDSERG